MSPLPPVHGPRPASSEPRFCRLLLRARVLDAAGRAQSARATYLAASRVRPTRAEPLYELARHYRRAGKFGLGYLFARRAAVIALPIEDTWLVETDVYGWRAVDELARCAFHTGRHVECFERTTGLLARSDLPPADRDRVRRQRELCRPWLDGERGAYRTDLVQDVCEHLSRGGQPGSGVTLTITAGRRLELFERTVNSFLHCCTDRSRIGRWLCVDSGSQAHERDRMRARFPFFEFVYLDPAADRHGDAMNRLLGSVSTPFWLHLEDDWQFVVRGAYVERAQAILADDARIAQVAFNRGYAEQLDDPPVSGRVRRTPTGLRYRVHDPLEPGSPEWDHHRHTVSPQQRVGLWWPHFTLNPSVMRTAALRSAGPFVSVPGREFELEFARRFQLKGLRTAFFDEVSCVHIGQPRGRGPVGPRVSAYDLLRGG